VSVLDVDKFRKRGYAVVRGVFDRDEAEAIRQSVVDEVDSLHKRGEAVVEEGTGGRALHPPGDMLTYESLRRVLLDRRLIGVVREALGDTPAYWGESSVVVGSFGGARAWHTDAYHTPVSQGRVYPMVRCGLYFQDIANFSGGLAVRPRSHVRRLKRIPLAFIPFRIALVDSEPGDLVIWDMRIVHAGEVVRFRPAPALGLPLSLQGRLPSSLRLDEQRSRVVMFPTFGLPGPDLDSYLEYQRTRDYVQELWRASRFPAASWQQAENAGLRLVRPVAEWGENGDGHGGPADAPVDDRTFQTGTT
jgi:hypothetical protein